MERLAELLFDLSEREKERDREGVCVCGVWCGDATIQHSIEWNSMEVCQCMNCVWKNVENCFALFNSIEKS